jgi:hypothetical protein
MGLNATAQDAILNFVMGSMFIILPVFWVGALGWAGISAGKALEGLATGTKEVAKAGEKGGQTVTNKII